MTKNNTAPESAESKAPQQTALSWKLKILPTVDEIQSLVEKQIISKEEARAILFNEVEASEKLKALEDQVEFLKGVIEKLGNHQPIQTVIKYVHDYPWRYYPAVWSSSGSGNYTIYSTAGNSIHNASMNHVDFGAKQLASSILQVLGDTDLPARSY